MFFVAACGGEDGDTKPEDEGPSEEDLELQRKLETVPKKAQVLHIKSSGTKCPPCGGWGWTANEEIIKKADGHIIPMTIHGGWHSFAGSFTNEESDEFDREFGSRSFPSFFAPSGENGTFEDQKEGAQTTADIVNKVLTVIDDYTAGEQNPVANVALKYEISNNEIKVDTRTRFFEETEGEYYIAVYITESDVQAQQSGHPDGNPFHKFVLRTATDDHATFGVPLNQGESIKADQLFEMSHSAEFPEGAWDKNNIHVSATIWKITGNLSKTIGYVNSSDALFAE